MKVPSPTRVTTVLSGLASLAPKAAPSAHPRLEPSLVKYVPDLVR